MELTKQVIDAIKELIEEGVEPTKQAVENRVWFNDMLNSGPSEEEEEAPAMLCTEEKAAEIKAMYKKAKEGLADWSARVYKRNNKTVSFSNTDTFDEEVERKSVYTISDMNYARRDRKCREFRALIAECEEFLNENNVPF